MRDRLRSLTIDHLWIITVLVTIWVFISLLPLPPNDLWWHMAAGRTMVAEGELIRTNRWAYTLPSDAPYVYQSWLSELVLYGLWRLGDVPLLALGRTLALAFSYGLIAWHAWRRSPQGKAVALALLLSCLVGWNNWTLRPQTLALVPGALFAVLLGEALDGRIRDRWLAALPIVMLVWVNLHGSFVLGLVLLGAAWLATLLNSLSRGVRDALRKQQQARSLLIAGLLTLLAAFANPLGPGIFGYLRDMLGNAPLQNWFIEWQPPQNDGGIGSTGVWFYLMLLLLAFLMARSTRRPSTAELLWYCGLAWLAIGGVRYAMWFGLLLAPLLAQQLAALFPARPPLRSNLVFTSGYLLLAAAALVAVLPWFLPGRYLGAASSRFFARTGPYRLLIGNNTPVAATDWLAEHPLDGHFWTDMTYSSYTIWRLPEKQVFADLRAELFPEAIWLDYFAIDRGDDESLAMLERWDISHLLLDRGPQGDLYRLLSNTPGWCEPFNDGRAVIMARCNAVQ